MEGQRILASLKGEGSWEVTLGDVKNYLAPVLSEVCDTKTEPSHYGKYELFSLKLFKLLIELLPKCKVPQQRSTLEHIGVLCVESLQVCNGSSGKAPPLSFEKMLLHFAKCCLTFGEYEVMEMSCRTLYTQLTGCLNKDCSSKKHSTEVHTLLKHAFDMLWKGAIHLEQKLGVSVCEKCLQLRALAIKCLLSSGDFKLAFVFDRIFKADMHYCKLCTNESTNKKATKKECVYKGLYSFHTSLLEHKDLLSLVRADQPCASFSTSVMYILHLVWLCTKSGHKKEALSHLNLALRLCNKHCAVCNEGVHVFVHAQAHCLQLWVALTGTNELVGNSLHINSHCQDLAGALEDVRGTEASSNDIPLLQKLIEYLENIVTHLKERRETIVSQREESDEDVSVAFVHRKTFEPLKSVLLNSVECLEKIVKTQMPSSSLTKLEQTARSRQLYLLSFLADVLVDLLHSDDDDDDEIETLRSSTVVKPPSLTQPNHSKQELAESCLPLLKNSQQIITKASSGVLPSSEHKWLGNDAYRLFQALFHCKLYREASEVLKVSCEELTYWCRAREGESKEQQLKRSLESHLLERFVHLCELYRMDSDYSDAMQTIEHALVSLPIDQITSEDCVSSLVGQWVKIKREIVSSNHEGLSSNEKEILQQCILQSLQQVRSLSDEVKALYLEAELKLYQSSSHSMHSSELPVIRSLLELYSHGDRCSELNRARLTIELAEISRQDGNTDGLLCDSPITLLDEAIALLDPLTTVTPSLSTTLTPSPSTTRTQSYQHLATAYLWKAICTLENHMNSCGQERIPEVDVKSSTLPPKPASDEREREAELCLSQDEECVLMSDDVLQCIYSAVEGWEGLCRVITKESIQPALFNGCFHNLPEMFHHLYLTSSLCLAHSQPVLALKSLCVMLEIYNQSASPAAELQASYQRALALYHHLLISYAGRELDTRALEATVSNSTLDGKESKKKELQESLLHCKLVLAEWYLSRGQADHCRGLLVDVLSDPFLEKSSTMSFFVVSKAKLLASEYLQQRNFKVLPSGDFLAYLLRESVTNPVAGESVFQLSPLELVVDSVKIFRQLSDHRPVRSAKDNSEEKMESVQETSSFNTSSGCTHLDEAFVGDDSKAEHSAPPAVAPDNHDSPPIDQKSASHVISPVVSAWEILVGHLSALKQAARLYLLQGNMNQAHCYAKEGAMLAKTMLLQGWYNEFSLLLCEIHLTRGNLGSSLVFINQMSKLLECEDYCKSIISSIETQVKSAPTPTPCGGDHDEKREYEDADSSDSTSSTLSDDSDDSFLAEMEASIRTPLLKGAGEKDKMIDHSLTVHPPECVCLMCVSHVSLLQNVKLALLVCELAMQMVLESQEEENSNTEVLNGCTETLLKVLSDASALLSNRIPKCNMEMKSIVSSRGDSTACDTATHSKSKPKSQRSTKARKSTKKSVQVNHDSKTSHSLDVMRSSAYFCVHADLVKLTADCHLLLLQPSEVITSLERAIDSEKSVESGETFSNEKLAQLHYTLGVTRVQELEIDHPELAKELWEGGSQGRETNSQTVVDQENEPCRANLSTPQDAPEENQPLGTRRPKRGGRKTVSKSKIVTQKQESSKPSLLKQTSAKVVEHFLIAYQLCYPSMPALLLRDTSRWLALLLSNESPNLGGHFLALSMNVTLNHQTIYSLGKKIKKHQSIESRSPFHHAQEALNSLTRSSPHFKPQQSNSILKARHLLQTTGRPPPLAYTKNLLTSLSPQWSICTICLAPKTHPARPTFLLLSRTKCGQEKVVLGPDDFVRDDEVPTAAQDQKPPRIKSSWKTSRGPAIESIQETIVPSASSSTYPPAVLMKIPTNGFSFLSQFDDIHQLAAENVTLKEKTEWWGARRSLDAKMKELLLQLESECLGEGVSLLSSDDGGLKTVILILGQHVQRMPWECLSSLNGQTVTRMPSLAFASAHKILLGHSGSLTVNPSSTYYVLNPHGDLLKTEKLFSTWFANESGWEGVVGKSPSHEEFTMALQDKDLYVYCGHSAGKFLATSGFHLLDCQATALLLGCSSGKLVTSGKCDPSGIALNYLIAGCPALVGCLWDVTDGEIDRFCQALLKSILEHNNKKRKSAAAQQRSSQTLKSLPAHVNSSRTACKLHCLVGAAPVVYGLPVTTRLRPH